MNNYLYEKSETQTEDYSDITKALLQCQDLAIILKLFKPPVSCVIFKFTVSSTSISWKKIQVQNSFILPWNAAEKFWYHDKVMREFHFYSVILPSQVWLVISFFIEKIFVWYLIESMEIILSAFRFQGTVIRVFTIPDGVKLFEFRRGMKRWENIFINDLKYIIVFSVLISYFCCILFASPIWFTKVLHRLKFWLKLLNILTEVLAFYEMMG